MVKSDSVNAGGLPLKAYGTGWHHGEGISLRSPHHPAAGRCPPSGQCRFEGYQSLAAVGAHEAGGQWGRARGRGFPQSGYSVAQSGGPEGPRRVRGTERQRAQDWQDRVALVGAESRKPGRNWAKPEGSQGRAEGQEAAGELGLHVRTEGRREGGGRAGGPRACGGILGHAGAEQGWEGELQAVKGFCGPGGCWRRGKRKPSDTSWVR